MTPWILMATLAAAVPQGELTVETGELSVKMLSSAGWTIRSVRYKDVDVLIPAGGQGAVIQPAGGSWIGSAMSSDETEPVSALEVTVDGEKHALSLPQTLTGERVVVEKHSTLGDLAHHAETVFEGERFVQTHTFTAEKDTNIATFYAFLYSFSPSMSRWAAQPAADEFAAGDFAGEGGRHGTGANRWLACYDPAGQVGAVIYFPVAMEGRGAYSNFWDTAGYRKFLAQPLTGAIAEGTELTYRIAVQFFAAGAETWHETAGAVATALHDEFPPDAAAEQPAAPRLYGDGVPEQGHITLKSGPHSVSFHAKGAWTIRDILFNDIPVGLANGYYGTVMVPQGDRWWGTGHAEGGLEIVHSLALDVDGAAHTVSEGLEVSGEKITLTKHSTIWKFDVIAETVVTAEHIYQRTRLTAQEDLELSLLYYFMHCFPPTTTRWLAALPDGSFEEGEFTTSKKQLIEKDTRWVAQYEPNHNLSLLSYTPKVISGPQSASHIWDEERYHKYYIRANRARSFTAGEAMDYSVVVQFVPGETGDWSATKAAAEEIAKQFPIVED